MARQINEDQLHEIEAAVENQATGMTAQQVHDALAAPPPRRTLQYRLKYLVDRRRLRREGSGRWARYLPPLPGATAPADESSPGRNEVRRTGWPPHSAGAARIQRHVSRPLDQRPPSEHHPEFLDAYRPNETFFLGGEQRARLRDIGRMRKPPSASGAYVGNTLGRFLIDLSWNSSRLEGNSCSLLETELFITRGKRVEGWSLRETQMILNHKAAIEFLTSSEEDIGVNRHTVLSLHALLADNLLSNPEAAGRLRRTPARLADSSYQPAAAPGQIEAQFDRLLATAAAISDPFEQSFFILAQVPYLQPFDDLNKCVARLAANIPLIQANLAPLTFENVPRKTYEHAVLGICELRRKQLFNEVFEFAYQRSASQYAAVRHLVGEPDPLRLKYRAPLRDLVGGIVRDGLGKPRAAARIRSWSKNRIDPKERRQLRDIVERELLSLHAGNCARYRINPADFEAWQEGWATLAG